MKYEWRKKDKLYYLPKNKPEILIIPAFKYLTLTGKGNPNSSNFSDAVSALYTLSYTMKMIPKKGNIPEGYFDYTVFPLEGLWDLENMEDKFNKDNLVYKIMIRQPDFVTEQLLSAACDIAEKKKENPLHLQAKLEIIEDGLCVQRLHSGSYDEEPASFDTMDLFCAENSLKRTSSFHREIYLNDATKTLPEKLKTVLRYKVDKISDLY